MNLKPLMFLVAFVMTGAAPSFGAPDDAPAEASESNKTEPTAVSEPAEPNSDNGDDGEAEPAEPSAATTETQPAASETEANETGSDDAEVVPGAASEPDKEDAPEAAASSEPEAEPEPAAAAPVPVADRDEPTAAESKTIAWVFAGITVASLAGGAYAGMEAQSQYDCLADVLTCNESRDSVIENEDYLKAKADLDRTVLLADMGFLTAVVTATVTVAAIVNALQGDDPEESETANVTSMLSAPQE